jgi:uncharacterized protein YecE (DUF72 family)
VKAKKNQFYVGCSGWSYSAWQGPFYPSNLDSSRWLNYYSNIFDYVEIDSSFYKIPNIFTVKNWSKKTPDSFRFSAKFPKVITHDKRLKDVSRELEYYFHAMLPLQDKTLALLLQLPPSLKITEGLESLRHLVPELDNRFRYAVEVRHKSWFSDLAYNFFANNNLCLVWNQLADIQTPPIVTTDFLYIRFIGDRSISEKDFGKIQKDRTEEMHKWANKIKAIQKEHKSSAHQVKLAIVSANNHYAGFGPETANLFRKMINLPLVSWEDNKLTQETTSNSKQESLSEFMSV